jgi:hypothetical protein
MVRVRTHACKAAARSCRRVDHACDHAVHVAHVQTQRRGYTVQPPAMFDPRHRQRQLTYDPTTRSALSLSACAHQTYVNECQQSRGSDRQRRQSCGIRTVRINFTGHVRRRQAGRRDTYTSYYTRTGEFFFETNVRARNHMQPYLYARRCRAGYTWPDCLCRRSPSVGLGTPSPDRRYCCTCCCSFRCYVYSTTLYNVRTYHRRKRPVHRHSVHTPYIQYYNIIYYYA